MPTPTEHSADPARVYPKEAIKTWGYLRLAMILVVVGLGVAVLYEHFKTPDGCWQTSISGYYYTPAGGFFVGALTAIAVCMVCLRGNTELEDVLLNIGGMLAPIVAFVPTPDAGTCRSVRAVPGGTGAQAHQSIVAHKAANIANNITALLVVGLIALVFAAWRARSAERTTRIGLVAAVLVWVTTAVVFEAARHFFGQTAHYTAAVLLFGCIIAVVVVNAFDFKDRGTAERIRNRYMLIAVLMGTSLACLLIAGAAGFAYWRIVLETMLLVLFGAFWLIQTDELWGDGLRGRGA